MLSTPDKVEIMENLRFIHATLFRNDHATDRLHPDKCGLKNKKYTRISFHNVHLQKWKIDVS